MRVNFECEFCCAEAKRMFIPHPVSYRRHGVRRVRFVIARCNTRAGRRAVWLAQLWELLFKPCIEDQEQFLFDKDDMRAHICGMMLSTWARPDLCMENPRGG